LIKRTAIQNTKKAAKVPLNVFRDYLKVRETAEDSLVISKDKLATVLRGKVYAEARKKNGELYTKASLVGIRFGLQRFFSSHKIDIIKTPSFLKPTQLIQRKFQRLNGK